MALRRTRAVTTGGSSGLSWLEARPLGRLAFRRLDHKLLEARFSGFDRDRQLATETWQSITQSLGRVALRLSA